MNALSKLCLILVIFFLGALAGAHWVLWQFDNEVRPSIDARFEYLQEQNSRLQEVIFDMEARLAQKKQRHYIDVRPRNK